MKADCIERPLARLYKSYGCWLAKHPLLVLAVSVVITAILGAGVALLEVERDAERLFTPNQSNGKLEREMEETLFNATVVNGTLANRLTRTTPSASIILVIKDSSKSITANKARREILRIDQGIKALVRSKNNKTYESICLKFYERCPSNEIIEVFKFLNNTHNDVVITYPTVILDNSKPYFIGSSLGGVDLENGIILKKAVAVRLFYPLSDESSSLEWEENFLTYVENLKLKEIIAYGAISSSLSRALDVARIETNPQIVLCVLILVTFSVVSSTKLDCAQNKPVLALLGVVSAGLATLSTIGLMAYFGVKFNVLITATPVLVISVGVDDMFILVAAWRKTSIRAPIEKRTGEAMEEAALSITITSLTNTLAFAFGSISPFPAVQAFCLYTGVAVMFDFIYQVTFFSAFMVLTGKRERANRHALTCKKVVPKSKAPSTSYLYCCAGGSDKLDIGGQEKHPHVIMKFFRDVYGEFLMNTWTKLFVFFIYVTYISISILYMLQMKIGIERRLLAPKGSGIASYYAQEIENFDLFGAQVCIFFDKELSYWDMSTQQNLESDINQFESTHVFHSAKFTTFWLRDYMQYLKLHNYTKYGKDKFINVLITEFLTDPQYKQYTLDIVFNQSNDTIIASRAYVSSKNISGADREQDLTRTARDLAQKSGFPMNVFAQDFIYYDQYFFILPNTVKNMIYSAISMLFISLLLIPRPLVSVWVVLTIVSIEIGVLGFMTSWNINLDFQSSIFVTLSTGFSVDFSAHIAYTYAVAPYKLGNKRTIYALYSVGMPMLQAGLSTVLGLLALSNSTTYILSAVFKIIFLVTVIGVIHGLVFLPVFLSVLGSWKKIRQIVMRQDPIELQELKPRDVYVVDSNPNLKETNPDNTYDLNGKVQILDDFAVFAETYL
ncbi:patched domain-containing protein 3-like [Anneissia japonica]|uniref:patched domain-containing protein 3-like n=1 Tax=Anneissia japonica TaxID=1529436 RepID=UPI0014259475|nr:patched domain-containing protein 3-like [Anneissia japonica]XP_033126913.1 patched domain-containing protein 3-like [Anneissia japonica]